jgi:hypothetical protein
MAKRMDRALLVPSPTIPFIALSKLSFMIFTLSGTPPMLPVT